MTHSNPADHQSKGGNVAEQAAVIIIENFNNSSSIVSDSSFYTNVTISATTAKANLSFAESYDVPTGLICLLAFLYGSISLLAVIGNGLVILVIVKNGRMHTVTNIFIANLAVADVIIGLFSIPFQFQAALLQRWVLANFMCSLAPFVQVISVNVSIFTLSVIAVDRYIAVIHPFKAGCSKKSAAIIITVIWAVGIGIAVPVQQYYWVDYIQEGDHLVPWCTVHPPESWSGFNDYYSMLLVCVQYLLPLVIITYCYSRIAWHIWGSRRPGAQVTCEDVRGRNKRKVVKMMIIVVCLFVLCWLPLQIYNLLACFKPDVNTYKYINIIWFTSNWLAMSNSCYNPFIYGLLNEKFKREFRQLFVMCPCLKPNNDYYTEYFSDDVNMYRRANNNGHVPANRHGAVRYNFYRDNKKGYGKQVQIQSDETETSQI